VKIGGSAKVCSFGALSLGSNMKMWCGKKFKLGRLIGLGLGLVPINLLF